MSGATDSRVTATDLRAVDLFADLGDDDLRAWAAVARLRHVEPGDVVLEVGMTPEGMVCLLEGTLQNFTREGDRFEPAGRQVATTWSGAIAVMTEGVLGVRMTASTPCRIAVVPAEDFRRLALAFPSVHRRVMRQIEPIMSRIAAHEQSRERLAALGTMAAGLAHELNNPAAAARRSAAELAEALDAIGSTLRQFVEAGIEREDAARIVELQEQAVRQASERTALDALDAADAEDAVLDQLEELGIPEPWRLAEPLARAGVDGDWLARLRELAGPATAAVLRSTAASLSAHALVGELREATERMSSLVTAVKAYAYMDRGALVQADIHEGLETTLAVLAHKLKHTDVRIERDYDRSLPPATVYGSELNQVWTNLLDNAIDAVGDRGTITLRTGRDGDCVVVDVADSGPGIPAAVQPRIFEPFFTTKEVGQGTGLGLDTARRIVHDRHGGSLSFDTGAGGTTFHVRLPLRPSDV